MDTTPSTDQTNNIDDLLDFLGGGPEANTNTTSHHTTPPQSYFDSLADFSLLSDAKDEEEDNSTAPDLLLDVPADQQADNLDSFVLISEDDLLSGTSDKEPGITSDKTDGVMDDDRERDMKNESEVIRSPSPTEKMEEDTTVCADVTDMNTQNNALPKEEFDFDVLQLPGTSGLGLDAEHFKGNIARKGSLALRRKPSRKGVRSIFPSNENDLFKDSTEPKPEVVTQDESSEEKDEASEDIVTPSSKSPPKKGFAMPGLMDLKGSKLFASRSKSNVETESSETKTDEKAGNKSEPIDSPVSHSRVLPSLPPKGLPSRAGVRVLPSIPKKEEETTNGSETESTPTIVLRTNSQTGISKDDKSDVNSEKEPKSPTLFQDVQREKISQNMVEETRDSNDIVPSSPTSPTKVGASTESVRQREKPLLQSKPERLSSIRKELPKTPEKGNNQDLVSQRNSINSSGPNRDEDRNLAQTSRSNSVDKSVDSVTKTDVSDKIASDSNVSKNLINSKKSDSKDVEDTKVVLRKKPQTTVNASNRYSTSFESLSSRPNPAKSMSKEDKRKSYIPPESSNHTPTWLTEMKLKKPPLSEKNGMNQRNQTSTSKDEEAKPPSWMKEVQARKNRMKTEADTNGKLIEDTKPEKPTWLKSSPIRPTKTQENSKIIEVPKTEKPSWLKSTPVKSSKVLETENQENGETKDKKINPLVIPHVQLRKSCLKENSSHENGDSTPIFANVQLRKARSSPMKEAPKESTVPEFMRKAEEKRARLMKSGMFDQKN